SHPGCAEDTGPIVASTFSKLQIPSSKLQRNIKHQAPNGAVSQLFDLLELPWCLELGAWSFRPVPGRRRDRHCLDIHELADAFRAELAAEAGTLGAAKRQPRIGSDHTIDEHHPGLQLPGEKFLLRRIVRPGARSQAERTVI